MISISFSMVIAFAQGDVWHLLQEVEEIQATERAFAAKTARGVVTWGDPTYGGYSRSLQDELQNVTLSRQICMRWQVGDVSDGDTLDIIGY